MALNRQTVRRTMDYRNAADEGLEKSEEHVIRKWKKVDPCYVAAENSAKFSLQLCGKQNWSTMELVM